MITKHQVAMNKLLFKSNHFPGAHFHHLCLEVFHESPCYVAARAPHPVQEPFGHFVVAAPLVPMPQADSSRVTDVITIKCSWCQQIAFGLKKP